MFIISKMICCGADFILCGSGSSSEHCPHKFSMKIQRFSCFTTLLPIRKRICINLAHINLTSILSTILKIISLSGARTKISAPAPAKSCMGSSYVTFAKSMFFKTYRREAMSVSIFMTVYKYIVREKRAEISGHNNAIRLIICIIPYAENKVVLYV
jgi:hypothetical protein